MNDEMNDEPKTPTDTKSTQGDAVQSPRGWTAVSKDWFKHRFGLGPIKTEVLEHRVTRTPWYYGDGATLTLLFTILLGTGMFLALDYSPSPATAYESVVRITNHNALGWYVRALHYWSAGMMVIMALFHLMRHVLLGGYLPPREGNWLIGVGLFFLIIINSFLGYTLRWDETAIYAMRVPLHILQLVPLIGDDLVIFVQGGWSLGASTLSRYYAVHVLFVPFAISGLIAYHLYLVIRYGATTMAERKHPVATAEEQIELRNRLKKTEKHGVNFYPVKMSHSSIFAMGVLAIVLALVFLLGPTKLEPKANLTSTAFPHEEWWWSWYSALTAYLPSAVAPIFHVTFPIVLLLLLVSLPFVDQMINRGAKRRPLAIVSVSLIVLALLGLSGKRVKSTWTAWPQKNLAPLPPDVNLSESALRGHRIFTTAGCFNCHALGGNGSGVGPNLTGHKHRLSEKELHSYIEEPPQHAAMPSYRDRLSAEDLQAVVNFVLAVQVLPRVYSPPEGIEPFDKSAQ